MQIDLDVIRDHVWPDWMRDNKIAALCPCQYGLCGACRQGRHDRCLTTQMGGPALDDVYDYMVTRGCIVVATILWQPGERRCAYRCPCPQQHTHPTPEPDDVDTVPVSAHRRRPIRDVPLPEPSPEPVQAALFDL